MQEAERGEEFGPDLFERTRWANPFACGSQSRWGAFSNLGINSDLRQVLPQLQAACDKEYALNAIFQGVVNTLKQDVVGRQGPNLQVISDNPRFNRVVELNWRKVFAKPDPTQPSLGGVESMKQWVHLLANAGSWLNVLTEPTRADGVAVGWKTLHPRRLVQPLSMIQANNIAFGIQFNETTGAPEKYFIDKPKPVGGYQVPGIDFDTLDRDQIQHRFLPTEPGQLTGVPMMAPCLSTAADIRALDAAELAAMKLNAEFHAVLEAADPDSVLDPEPIDGDSIPVRPNEMTRIPMGWQSKLHDANRPSTNHIEYRRERVAEYGRPFGMPLLVVLLTVADVNFSSAQFGGSLYAEAIADLQGFIERQTLNELVELVILELVLSGAVERPDDYRLAWTHNVPPNANIEKFAKSLRSLVEDGIISRPMATAWLGFDPEEVAKSRQRDNETADALDISRAPTNAGDEGETETETEIDAEILENANAN